MNKLFLSLFLIVPIALSAQFPGGRPGAARGQNFNMGHFYGKVVDEKTGKGIEGVSVQLYANRFDSATKKQAPAVIKAGFTASNGDFSLDNLPVMGNFSLKFSAIGYKAEDQKVNFGLKMPSGGQANREDMLSMVDKDLGNIKLAQDAANLGNVTVTTTKALFEMGVDRKIFNVDKNLTSTGQSATEIMKSIPSLSVDIDGNVTMRNAAPQLFVDGRPTTMTLDQIPADIIEKVELITNPSAKFDASGGNAGILNIVLKKNKKVGYNGGLRAGIDSRWRPNIGGDINFRTNKLNFFLNGMYNRRKSISTSTNDRINMDNKVETSRIYQQGTSINEGYFAFLRTGFDYLIDNRNTLTASINFNRGNFKNDNAQRVDSSLIPVPVFNSVMQNSDGNWRNLGTQLSYKHNFAKTGHEFTADANYNSSSNDNLNYIKTQTYLTDYQFKGLPVIQRSIGDGEQKNYTFQADYSNPITENQKIETGARASIRDYVNDNFQYFYNNTTGKFDLSQNISSRYRYTDKVYAAYANYSMKLNNWSYQFGLRAESSTYDGAIINKNMQLQDSASSFQVNFPLSLFPSAFVTYKISDKEDMQLNYSRRINRPNFWQLMPFPDYSDPYNISVGNARLKPEFTNSFEVSYNNNYKKGVNFLASAYFKHNTNLITRYQYQDANPDTAHHYSSSDTVLFNTYLNANTSYTFGIELTNKIPVTSFWDMTINANLFNSKINVSDPKQQTINNQRTSWFVKMNNNIKLFRRISLQLSGDYYAKTVLPQGGGGGRGGWGGGPTATAQGYINPRYSFDVALRKDWTWKGGSSGSLTLSMNDFLRTQLYSTYSESPFLIQTAERRRDPQILRVNFSYRFGKFDVNLFKRKNTNTEMSTGTEMMPG